MQARTLRPSPALIISIIALCAALSGTAWAALGKNSVGTKQLKSKSVTTGKIANNSITGAKVKAASLTSSDVNLGALGVVPSASNAQNALDAKTVNGHAAECPSGSTLIRGICFDLGLNSPAVPGVKAAAAACATKGGNLPTPMELYSVRNVINLGNGISPNYAVADDYYANTGGSAYRTVTIDGAGKIEEQPIEVNTRYICAYDLVR
jgi:hypothetical protein